jgi:hypothetical protein
MDYNKIKERLYNRRIISKNGCWEWQGYLDKDGYGQISLCHQNKKKTTTCHRISYIIHKGDIPEGMMLRHSCDNRKCFNPEHLDIGTAQDNSNDMITRGRYIVTSGAFRKGDQEGENNTRAKLNWEIVNKIREDYAKGIPYGGLKKMASEYGIAYVTIQKVVANKIWITPS